MPRLKIIIYLFILIGMIGLGTANGYFSRAFWRGEALWLDEGDFDEDVDRWMRYGNLALKTSMWSFVIAVFLGVFYWILKM